MTERLRFSRERRGAAPCEMASACADLTWSLTRLRRKATHCLQTPARVRVRQTTMGEMIMKSSLLS